MAVFVSFAKEDQSFAERLSAELVKKQVIVFFDQWELKVGNKLTDRLTKEINEAEFICIILSKASVEVLKSEDQRWFKREFELALELEKNVGNDIIIPIIIDDCEIPTELQDKVRSNFNIKGFDEGIKEILLAVSSSIKATTYRQAREDRNFVYDWAIDWYINKEKKLEISLDVVEFSREFEWSILTKVSITSNSAASYHFKQRSKKGLGEIVVYTILGFLAQHLGDESLLLSDNKPSKKKVDIEDPRMKYKFHIEITSRKLGKDTGRDFLIHTGNYYEQIFGYLTNNNVTL
ncbi:hypothetical protein J53TS2_36220 [Paenibacillus sp. J53TS2]|uniref:toll/interleukin-1 receptor domain-containing protein n=1 Tax=Paenibacillus sp. J53TS2 TaxID=2807197 RepID=UPI001B21AC90|nr:toll/interleukin-1 receptor domain-containing protein [Paenibacillus sp. J53TS2]GIP50031.1 hypothetical protein J53TS2_36220 [Paenibacillus sp. J53TS2]